MIALATLDAEMAKADSHEISVTEGGGTVYLHPKSSDEMYLFDTNAGTFSVQPFYEAYFTGAVSAIQIHFRADRDRENYDIYEADGQKYYTLVRGDSTIGEITYSEGVVWGENAPRTKERVYDTIEFIPMFLPKGYEDVVREYEELSDGTYLCEGQVYKYRLEITGRMSNAAKDSTFVYLSNIEEISFDRAWKAAGLSSSMDDYFSKEEAVLVEWR